jgi:hypothetical protein
MNKKFSLRELGFLLFVFAFVFLVLFCGKIFGGSISGANYVSLSNTGTTNAYAVFPAQTVPPRLIRVMYVNATSDLAGSKLNEYVGQSSYALTVGVTNSTTFTVASTVGIAVGSYVTMQNADGNGTPGNVYFGLVSATNATVVTIAASTNAAAANAATFAIGDTLWLMTGPQSVPIGAATVQQNSECIFSAQAGRPLLLILNGTAAVTISKVMAHYEPPQ